MILLTDEEIEQVTIAWLKQEGMDDANEYEWSVDEEDKMIAKAQLKKVIEWLKERKEYDDASVNGGSHAILISYKDWQAILDEMKNDS